MRWTGPRARFPTQSANGHELDSGGMCRIGRSAPAAPRAPPKPCAQAVSRCYAATTCGSQCFPIFSAANSTIRVRSEEHTSELQSPLNLVCRLLLEKKKKNEDQSLFNNFEKPENETSKEYRDV